ncbi:YeeE/YedE family protein [Marinoscillum luteum]|uniref:YeeE/YedE family protein n=1 Tax=Marinoscillum luteum TaxID=861051 RepID=A0ABW7N4J6_9BACT
MKELITAPWPWYVAGPLITLVMVLMLLFGKSFGISSTLKTVCSIGGAGRWSDFFRFDWKSASWNLFFAAGAILGGYIASTFMAPERAIALNPATVASLQTYGIDNAGTEFLPREIFNLQNLLTGQGLIFMVLGGFMVGFGTRYADGCTSGHAISGLSNLQWPSLVAVVGFFIGGLIVTHLILPSVL